jgi:oxygen-dependent protoporphyrinogen oxidase
MDLTQQNEAAQPKRVIVVGAGVAGLAAAHRLTELAGQSQQSLDLTILEANDRPGGSTVTVQRDGFLIEGGPDSFITQKPWGVALCKRLGIESELIGTNPNYRRTFVVHRGKLHAVPEGFLLLAPSRFLPMVTTRLFSWPGKMRMGLDLILPAKDHGDRGDESLASFVRRRLGREALERMAQPLVGGIYTADPEYLSLRATMPRFLDMERNHRSLILAMRKGRKQAAKAERGDSGARYSMFVSFREGMSTLINTLVDRLPADSLRLESQVTGLSRNDSEWSVNLADGTRLEADAVVLATPSHVTSKLTRALDTELADALDTVPYAASATMTMAFRRDQIQHELDGFGFVVPAIEKRTLIAATFSSVKFDGRAPDDWLLIRAFLGGATHPHVYAMDDKAMERAVVSDLKELVGLDGEPKFVELHRWPGSMPQYPVGHLDNMRRVYDRLSQQPALDVAGNAYAGVGIPDCVHTGEQAAERIANRLGLSKVSPASTSTTI